MEELEKSNEFGGGQFLSKEISHRFPLPPQITLPSAPGSDSEEAMLSQFPGLCATEDTHYEEANSPTATLTPLTQRLRRVPQGANFPTNTNACSGVGGGQLLIQRTTKIVPVDLPSSANCSPNSELQNPQHELTNNSTLPLFVGCNGGVSMSPPVRDFSVPYHFRISPHSQQQQMTNSACSRYGNANVLPKQTSWLQQTENGSFYIPSGATPMSTLSSSRGGKEKITRKRSNSYTLLPSAQTTVPVPILPIRPEEHAQVQLKHQSSDLFRLPCHFSWKYLAYCLAAVLLLCFAVIMFLTAMFFNDSTTTDDGRLQSFERQYFSPVALTTIGPGRPFPASFPLGDEIIAELLPGVTQSHFSVQRNSYVQFNISVDPQIKLGIYARMTLPASPTQYDWNQILLGPMLHSNVQRRDSEFSTSHQKPKYMRGTAFVQYLHSGKWYLSLLNDDTEEFRTIRFTASLIEFSKDDCKYNCWGNGACRNGTCQCDKGFSGIYCEEMVCPVLCSGNGIYTAGRCVCHHGYKGVECEVPEDHCESDCSGHGYCYNGNCVCHLGYTGKFCDSLDCVDPNCNKHGLCVSGTCYCEFGWRGVSCEEAYTSAALCPGGSVSCSGHGFIDSETGSCACDSQWVGEFCQNEACLIDCGMNGKCSGGVCVCAENWTGDRCDYRSCFPGCEDNGECRNGTCVCKQGYEGVACQLESCSNQCGKQGSCLNQGGSWACVCNPFFVGEDCSIPVEHNCTDSVDNDNDGLVDCEDSECCDSPRCKLDNLCRSIVDPLDVLLRKQASVPEASFFQRVRFLLDNDSVQQYPDMSLFVESHVSVIRGRTVDNHGAPLTGIRINDVANAQRYGFTISRTGGHFDLVVNGGGVVSLQFTRRPFVTALKTFFVTWNRIVFVGDVVMPQKQNSKQAEVLPALSSSCLGLHEIGTMFPSVLSSWQLTQSGGLPSVDGLLAGPQTIQQSLRIPRTNLHLVYNSGFADGYECSLILSLIPSVLPKGLRLIKLFIDVEGRRFEMTLEAMPNLTYVFGWDKRNVYRQKVYGLVPATVRVGYVYKHPSCNEVFWEVQELDVLGHIPSVSEVGGFNFAVHHWLLPRSNLLVKGDGSIIYFNQYPHLQTIVGTGLQRRLGSDNEMDKLELFYPYSVASSLNGSLFIGDYDLIRRLDLDGSLTTVLELSPSNCAHKYTLRVNPTNNELFVALPVQRQVIRVVNAYGTTPLSPLLNYEVVAGTSKACVSSEGCGDGGPAQMARLNYPKSLTFDATGRIYILDERKIRVVDLNGVIQTIFGNGSRPWHPLSCIVELTPNQINFQWPIDIEMNPLSGDLLIVDMDVLFSVNLRNGLMRILAGLPSGCDRLQMNSGHSFVASERLVGVQSIACGPSGKIFIAETDGKRLHRVREVHKGKVLLVAGAESKCDCHRKNCPCDDIGDKNILAKDAHLHSPVSLSAAPNGILYITDQDNFKIRAVRSAEVLLNSASQNYEVLSPESHEVYAFNRFGKHVFTKDLLTERFLYNFSYHADSSLGKLVQISDGSGQRITISRHGSRLSIDTSSGRANITLNHHGLLHEFRSKLQTVSFDWTDSTGLVRHRSDSGFKKWIFEYDEFGCVFKMIGPLGNVFESRRSLNGDLLDVIAIADGVKTFYTISEHQITIDSVVQQRFIYPHLPLVRDAFNRSLLLESHLHPDSKRHKHAFYRRKVSYPLSKEGDGRKELSHNTVEWRMFKRPSGKHSFHTTRTLLINGDMFLSFDYQYQHSHSAAVYNKDGARILTVTFDTFGNPVQYKAENEFIAPLNISYEFGRPVKMIWGTVELLNDVFDRHKPMEIEYKQQNLPAPLQFNFTYSDGRLQCVKTPSGLEYQFSMLLEFSSFLYSYVLPDNSVALVFATDLYGRTKFVSWPDGKHRLVVEYKDGLLYKLLSDSFVVNYTYVPGTSNLKEVQTKSYDLVLIEKTEYQGHLVKGVIQQQAFSNDEEVVSHFAYHYDATNSLRLKKISVGFHSVTLPPLHFSYSPTGQLKSIGVFNFSMSQNKQTVSVGVHFECERFYDSTLHLTKDVYTVRGKVVCEQRFALDPSGRIKVHFVTISQEHYSVKYEYQGSWLLSVTSTSASQSDSWMLQYNEDGELASINNQSVVHEIDIRGFTVARDSAAFEMDSLGRLIRASNGPNRFSYFYDAQNRLILRHCNNGSSLHFYYALLHKPALITHLVERPGDQVIQLFYDTDDRLIAVERSGSLQYVVSTYDGTPRFLLSNDGELLAKLVLNPFGALLSASVGTDSFPIGFKGCFQEHSIGVVIFSNGRPYDAVYGRWLSYAPDMPFRASPYKSGSFDLLRFNENDPVNAQITIPRDTSEWLQVLGYDFSNLIPTFNTGFCSAESSRIFLSYECGLQRKIHGFNQMLSVDSSSVLTTNSDLNSFMRFAAAPSVLSESGIVLSNTSSGHIAVHAVSSMGATILQKTVSVVLNGTVPLSHWSIVGGKTRQCFVKENASATKDLEFLSVKEGTLALSQNVNITIYDGNNLENPTVKFDAPYTSLIVYYAANSDEIMRLLAKSETGFFH